MAKGNNFFVQMMEDSSVDAVAGKPIIEISGDRRVLIENHQGVAA